MHIGMLFFGAVFQIIGAAGFLTGISFLSDLFIYTLSLWVGVFLAMLSAYHIYRTLDRSLDLGEAASKLIVRGYYIRYVCIVAIMIMIIVTGVLNPLVTFWGYMSLKVTALMQPVTHRLCNRFFGETDPEPEPIDPDEEEPHGEAPPEENL
jgi:hypothetical protein